MARSASTAESSEWQEVMDDVLGILRSIQLSLAALDRLGNSECEPRPEDSHNEEARKTEIGVVLENTRQMLQRMECEVEKIGHERLVAITTPAYQASPLSPASLSSVFLAPLDTPHLAAMLPDKTQMDAPSPCEVFSSLDVLNLPAPRSRQQQAVATALTATLTCSSDERLRSVGVSPSEKSDAQWSLTSTGALVGQSLTHDLYICSPSEASTRETNTSACSMSQTWEVLGSPIMTPRNTPRNCPASGKTISGPSARQSASPGMGPNPHPRTTCPPYLARCIAAPSTFHRDPPSPKHTPRVAQVPALATQEGMQGCKQFGSQWLLPQHQQNQQHGQRPQQQQQPDQVLEERMTLKSKAPLTSSPSSMSRAPGSQIHRLHSVRLRSQQQHVRPSAASIACSPWLATPHRTVTVDLRRSPPSPPHRMRSESPHGPPLSPSSTWFGAPVASPRCPMRASGFAPQVIPPGSERAVGPLRAVSEAARSVSPAAPRTLAPASPRSQHSLAARAAAALTKPGLQSGTMLSAC